MVRYARGVYQSACHGARWPSDVMDSLEYIREVLGRYVVRFAAETLAQVYRDKLGQVYRD